MRKNGAVTFRRNRTSVGDEYGAGNPEVRVDSYRQITRTGGKRDFSPCVYRGLGERIRARVREYAREKFVDPTLVDTKAGNIIFCTVMYYLNILYCNVLSEDSCPASEQGVANLL